MHRGRSVHIYQTYIPSYRTSLFDGLKEVLALKGISLEVTYSAPSDKQAARNDADDLPWGNRVTAKGLTIGRRTLTYLPAPSRSRSSPDLLILEQALGNLKLLSAIAHRAPKTALALWGHGAIHTRHASKMESRLLARATMHADHFFAYTQSSADAIERIGFPRARTTVLNNAVDTRALRQATQSMTPESHKNSAMFIGALDDSKDLPLLVDAANLVHKTTPSFVLDVIGDGPRRPWLEALASQQPWIRVHGPSRDPAFKAMIASKAACFVLTGRIGLAVVEAFALGLPVIATNFPFSAPESGYLEQGKNSLISHPSAPDLAYSITSVLSDQTLRETLAKNAQTSGGQYTLENMIIRFADGILTALESPKRIMASSDARATSTS